MKNVFKIAGLSLLVAGLFLAGCKKTEDPNIDLNSLMAGTIDLNGATQATDVPTDATIVATFSTNVDGASANTTNVKLMRGSTDVNISVTAAGSMLTITPGNSLLTGTQYTLSMSGIKSDKGKMLTDVSVGFLTVGVGLDTPPQASSQVMYLQLNGTVTDLTGNATDAFDQITYTADRYGNANGAAMFNGSTAPGNGDIVELSGSKFITPSSTYSVWFKLDPADYAAGSRIMFGEASERGIFLEMGGDLAWFKLATSHKVDPDPNNHYFGTAWTDPNGSGDIGGQILQIYTGSIADLIQNHWNQLVFTFDAYNSLKSIYLDGIQMRQDAIASETTEWYLKDFAIGNKADGTGDPVAGIDPVFTLGYFCSRANTATGWTDYSTAENTFKGALDDFRIWNKALTLSEVQDLYNSEKPAK
jgi:hypothetical protein